MAIPRKQIGWGADTNLLWGIWKALDRLTQVTSKNKPVEPEPPVDPPNNKSFTLISRETEEPFFIFDISRTESFLTTISAISLEAEKVYYLALYSSPGGPKVEPKFVFPIPTHTQGAGFVVPISDEGVLFKTGITGAIFSYVPGSEPIPIPKPIPKDKIFLNFTYKETQA